MFNFKKGPSRGKQERDDEEEKEGRAVEARRQQEAIEDGEGFVRDFIRECWGQHMEMVRVHCRLTMREVRLIGSLPQAEGVRACGSLFSVPVIHDEIAFALWKKLAVEIQGEEFMEQAERRRSEVNERQVEQLQADVRRLQLDPAFLVQERRPPAPRRKVSETLDQEDQLQERESSVPGTSSRTGSLPGQTLEGNTSPSSCTPPRHHACAFCPDRPGALSCVIPDDVEGRLGGRTPDGPPWEAPAAPTQDAFPVGFDDEMSPAGEGEGERTSGREAPTPDGDGNQAGPSRRRSVLWGGFQIHLTKTISGSDKKN